MMIGIVLAVLVVIAGVVWAIKTGRQCPSCGSTKTERLPSRIGSGYICRKCNHQF